MSHPIREIVTKEVGCPMRMERNEVEQYQKSGTVLQCSCAVAAKSKEGS